MPRERDGAAVAEGSDRGDSFGDGQALVRRYISCPAGLVSFWAGESAPA
jgi:hypothetical protein